MDTATPQVWTHLRALRAAAADRRASADAAGPMRWEDDAKRRLGRVPAFIRGHVRGRTERFARERGHKRVSDAVFLACKDAST